MTSARPSAPEKLTRAHDRSGSGPAPANWTPTLTRYAWQNQRANDATTYVSHLDGAVVGYYSLTVASYARADAPGPVGKGAPQQIPCILLARLAVDLDHRGRGLAAGLLLDSMQRAVFVSGSIGARAFLVHARDDDARAFYLHNGDFLPSPVDPLHLFVPIRTLAAIPGLGLP